MDAILPQLVDTINRVKPDTIGVGTDDEPSFKAMRRALAAHTGLQHTRFEERASSFLQ